MANPTHFDIPTNRAGISDYIALARLDHVTKQAFIVPGIILALLLRDVRTENALMEIVIGFVAATAIASANYVINEYLDRNDDRHHPTKSARVSVQKEVNPNFVIAMWAALAATGLGLAYMVNVVMFGACLCFVAQGIIYNVRPLRLKEVAYLDVISESVNNPIRLIIGWSMIDPTSVPPASIILAFWLGGAFLMGTKRLSEYREIVASHGKDLLVRYRRSFAGYTEVSLFVSCFLYALLSSAFLAVFLIKYRIEYVLLIPIIAALFATYLALAMAPGSTAQRPERLFKERGLMGMVALTAIIFLVTTFVDIPVMAQLTEQTFIEVGSR